MALSLGANQHVELTRKELGGIGPHAEDAEENFSHALRIVARATPSRCC
jgi:hypothetical protein